MLSYKLCKQLKDAGFPQYNKAGKCINCGNHQYHLRGEAVEGESVEMAREPMLSELIEACKITNKDCWGLYRVKGEWRCGFEGAEGSTGKTPEEAVAKLWLELNR